MVAPRRVPVLAGSEHAESSNEAISDVEAQPGEITTQSMDGVESGEKQWMSNWMVSDVAIAEPQQKSSVPVPCAQKLSALSVAERKVMDQLDADGDGQIDVSEVIASVKRQAKDQQSIRSLRRRQLAFCVGGLIGLCVLFGVVFAANWQSRELFLSYRDDINSHSAVLVTRDGEDIHVENAKTTVPLYLAPFLDSEDLRDIAQIMYYDCDAEQEVWARVISVRRFAPAEVDEQDEADILGAERARAAQQTGNAEVALILASGREMRIDARGGHIFFPHANRTQELCGELECASVRLKASALADLEQRAAEIVGEEAGRRLQRRGGRPNQQSCRRCGPRPPQGGRRRRTVASTEAPPTQNPSPSTTNAPSTPKQQAVWDVAQAASQLFSNSPNAGDTLGGIVRLAFHDAGTFDGGSGTGGADGCVDLSALENRGLAAVIDELEQLVSVAAGRLSRADVWALAAGVAIEFAGGPELEFQVGRIDSSSCSGHAMRLPNAELGRAHVIERFVTTLGFSERETAALMGAHVLGAAVRDNSGYNRAWVPNNDRFTNDYFRDLLDRPWNRNPQPRFEGQARTQWNGPRNTMMLNTDIELAFDTSSGCGRAGGRGQGGGRCPRAAGALSQAITEFSNRRGGEGVFFQTFSQAFTKLMALGAENLVCALDDCSTPGPF